MKVFILLALVISVVLVSGCIQSYGQTGPALWVYKTKADYTNMMSFVLDDNNEVGLLPALPHPGVVNYKDGFYYARRPKAPYILSHTVIVNMTLDEWEVWTQTHDNSDLVNYIIEMNPITEAYLCESPDDIPSLAVGEVPHTCESVQIMTGGEELTN